MDNSEQPNIKPLQFIVAAMAAGLIVLTVTLVGAKQTGAVGGQETDSTMLLAALGAVAVVDLIGFCVLRAVLRAKVRGQLERAPTNEAIQAAAWPAFQVMTIIGGGMFEGLGLFGAVVYLFTGMPLTLLAPGMAVLLIVVIVPTRWRFESFVEGIKGSILR